MTASITERTDEPTPESPSTPKKRKYKKKPKSKPIAQAMAEAAQAGDFEELMNLFESGCSMNHAEYDVLQKHLRTAMAAAGDQDPGSMMRFLFHRILAFDATLMLRAQSGFTHALQGYDTAASNPFKEVPEVLAEEWLPRIARLEDSVKSTVKLYSQTAHVMGLAEAKAREAENVIRFAQPPAQNADEADEG